MDWEAAPLPLEATPEICKDVRVSWAYEVAVACEREAASQENENNQTFFRVLGYLLREAPSQQIRQAVAADILRCRENERELIDCGYRYIVYFIGLFKKIKRYPATPLSSSWELATVKELIRKEVVASPKADQKIRKDALERDGFRCVASGRVDFASAWENVEVRQLPGQKARTEAAYIIPRCLNDGNKSEESARSEAKLDYHGTVFAILEMFGYSPLKSALSGQAICDLSNVMILASELHDHFDHLDLWFEPQEEPQTYKVCMTWKELKPPDLCGTITFTCATEKEFPLPSRCYLTLHAFCARVAHLSGAAEYIEKIHRDRDEIGVLAEDGSSAKVLEYLLYQFEQPVPQASPLLQPVGPSLIDT